MTSVVVTQTTINASVVQESVSVSVTSSPINVTISPVDINSHSAVTIGTANGLSLSGQVLSLGLSSALATGALSNTDWSTFNNKQNALGYTPVNIASVDWIDLTDGGATVLHSHAASGISGSGVVGRLAEWVTDTTTLQAAKIIGPASNILTITNAADSTLALNITSAKTLTLTSADDYTLTVPATGTVDLLGTAQTITATKTFTTTQFIDSSADAIELRLQAHSTKTTNYLTIENSAGALRTVIDETGWISIGGDNPTRPLSIITSAGNSTSGGLYVEYVSSYTGGATHIAANLVVQTPNGTNAGSAYEGLKGQAKSGSSATTVSKLVGFEGHVLWQTTSGTLTTAQGAMMLVSNTNAGVITNATAMYIQSTINSGAGSITVNTGLHIEDMTVGTSSNRAIFTGVGVVSLLGSDTKASNASAVWKGIELRAATATITGSTNITTAAGFNYFDIARPTLSAASALTVTNAATLYIANSPLGGGAGPATITNPYSIWVDAGMSRFDGNGTYIFELPADATGNATAATGRIPVKIGGVTKYLRYYDD